MHLDYKIVFDNIGDNTDSYEVVPLSDSYEEVPLSDSYEEVPLSDSSEEVSVVDTDLYRIATYNIATYNIGKPFDYKNLILRNGSQSDADPKIQELFRKIKPGYDKDLQKYNENPSENKSYRDNPKNFTTKDELEVIREKRNECLTNVYKIMDKKCDIVMLQEVTNNSELELINKIFSDSFVWFLESQMDNKSCVLDTIVGWRKSVFECKGLVKGASQNIKMASVILRDKSNGLNIQATSLHAKGYSLTKPTKEDVKAGDDLVLQASKNIELPNVNIDLALIGGDYNSDYDPRHHCTQENIDLAKNRFKILENNGFFHVPQSAPTGFNEELNRTVDLDHLFVKEKRKLVNVKVLTGSFYDFPLENPAKNCSDHKPLFFEATICSKTIEEDNKQKRLELKQQAFK